MSKINQTGGRAMTKLTNPTNEQELREQVLTEFKQVHKLAPADYTENCTNVVMSIIQAHTNAEIASTLDRLEKRSDGLPCTVRYSDGSVERMRVVPLSAIQAERAKWNI